MRKDIESKDAWLAALGRTICERRAEVSMTQQQLAKLSGVHRTYISDIEHGSRNVTVTTANKIAGALSISTSTLFNIADLKVKQASEVQS